MSKKADTKKVSLYNRCLNGIERVGNSLPHPVVLFAIFSLAIVVISAVCAMLGVSAFGALTQEMIDEAKAFLVTEQYAEWAAQDNRMTAEIKAQLEEMEGKEEMSHRYFSSVSELEDAYGIKLLKLGEDECNVQATLCFLKEEDHAAGSHLIGWWNAYEDGAYLHTSVSCIYGNPEIQMSIGIPMTEAGEEIEYEIQSLGVTAKLVTAKVQGEREIDVFFSYDGVDYYFAVFQGLLSTNRNVTIEWVCDKLETLHE